MTVVRLIHRRRLLASIPLAGGSATAAAAALSSRLQSHVRPPTLITVAAAEVHVTDSLRPARLKSVFTLTAAIHFRSVVTLRLSRGVQNIIGWTTAAAVAAPNGVCSCWTTHPILTSDYTAYRAHLPAGLQSTSNSLSLSQLRPSLRYALHEQHISTPDPLRLRSQL